MKPILRAREVKFSYGAAQSGEMADPFRLSVDSFTLQSGELHAMIGPNGCGKSTLLRLFAGMLQPLSGDIFIDDKPLRQFTRSELARILAFLPQQVMPVFAVESREVVLLGRDPWIPGMGLPRPEDLQIAEEAMARVNVLPFRKRIFDTLSGGERQKVLLASILAQQPRAILLDEPTSALDIHHQIEVFDLLRTEARNGAAVLVVTHDLTLAAHFADRVTLLDHGQTIGSGTPAEVIDEQRLRAVYGSQVRVAHDSKSGLPYVIPDSRDSRTAPAASPPTPQSMLHRQRDEGATVTAAPARSTTVQPGEASLTPARFMNWLLGFTIATILAIVISPWGGAEGISVIAAFREMLNQSASEWQPATQILALRLPRIFMGLAAGMGLGCVGAAYQAMLRNALAEPFTLGMASFSSLGAVIAISCPALAFTLGPISGVQTWAFGFALLSVAFLWLVTQRTSAGRNVAALLLGGITLSLISASLIMLVRFLASPLTLRAMDQWMIGGIEVTGWRDLLPSLPFLIPGLALVLAHARNLNQIGFGDELARGRGVDVVRVHRHVFIGGSMVTAAVVAVVGPIAFVGLIVPHIVRKLVGSDQRLVLPCSLLGGGTFLMIVDLAARCLSLGGRGAELPVGILTGLLGGPLLLVLLLRHPSRS